VSGDSHAASASSGAGSDCRLLIISNIPTPNNDALFSALHRTGITLCVAYCDKSEPNRLWTLPAEKGYTYVVLPGVSLGPFGRLNMSVFGVLRRFRPNRVVLTGSYALPTIQMVAWWLTMRRHPWWYWAEELSWEPQGFVADAARRLLRTVLRFASGILAIGKGSAASFRRLGISEDKIAIYHYYADAQHFALPEEARRAERKRLRAALELPAEDPVFLFAGQLIPRKGLDIILRAFARLAERSRNSWLVVAGDGPDSASLRTLAGTLGVAERVRFTGFVPVSELPGYAAACDALLVASRREGWGLVVSEFMAAGLPVVASDRVNSALNLIQHDKSGYLFPSEDVEALERILVELASSRARRLAVGQEAKLAVEGERPVVAAQRLIALLGCGTAAGARPVGP
jgi:glycosyltransferase involved in cell wall biosynthesis